MLEKKELQEFIDKISDVDYTIASGCALMAQLQLGIGLCAMSFKITKKHNDIFDFDELIAICEDRQKKAMKFLNLDHDLLVQYKKVRKTNLLEQNLQSMKELTLNVYSQLAHLENEVYLPTRSDYRCGIKMIHSVLEGLLVLSL